MTPEINIESIQNALSRISDPGIPAVTINELGMLRDVKMEEDVCVVTIMPTYNNCPAILLIEEQIRKRVSAFGLKKIEIRLVYTPVWTTDWLSEETKKNMKLSGIAPPPHSSCVKALNDLIRVPCPLCASVSTELISRFGATPCKAMYKCKSCQEPFEHIKCH